ncbi:hypothetical protein Tco_1263536, partial [Tanacetum coccineum]
LINGQQLRRANAAATTTASAAATTVAGSKMGSRRKQSFKVDELGNKPKLVLVEIGRYRIFDVEGMGSDTQGANFKDLPGVTDGENNKVKWELSVSKFMLPSGGSKVEYAAVACRSINSTIEVVEHIKALWIKHLKRRGVMLKNHLATN